MTATLSLLVYVGPLDHVADLPGCRALRSSASSCLVMPPVKVVANWVFPVVLRIWYDLPTDVTSAESLSTFCQRLKTHLFLKIIPPAISWTLNNLTRP